MSGFKSPFGGFGSNSLNHGDGSGLNLPQKGGDIILGATVADIHSQHPPKDIIVRRSDGSILGVFRNPEEAAAAAARNPGSRIFP